MLKNGVDSFPSKGNAEFSCGRGVSFTQIFCEQMDRNCRIQCAHLTGVQFSEAVKIFEHRYEQISLCIFHFFLLS